eukprot:CAMPEP_0197828924 /NCGR_PEP_ID=MMETSP1437-20131217/5420_1 /TAXON_ID=49252 ORGANISM="Eucampia antarctica, Strain CCMP1452" /NCGR_SAMPLE_ID=MMETSP1437 /ASSEMBLY_ACC=CAM_ASM_001096 /LENGTH=43 /DNA_ID= /DNA_START= /DNA_END= /DNA_ORIENTATION=
MTIAVEGKKEEERTPKRYGFVFQTALSKKKNIMKKRIRTKKLV